MYKTINNNFIFYRNTIILMLLACMVNIVFLSVSKKSYFCSGLIAPHGEIAYNLYQYNSIKINPARLESVVNQQNKEQRLVHYKELMQDQLDKKPTVFRSTNDTIGYGVLLGLIWKITGSLSYSDICWLQIFIFCMLMPLLYSIALMLYNNHTYAMVSCLALLACTGLIFLNVRPLRDIWGFYGLVLLVHMLLKGRQGTISTKMIILQSIGFALCQWLRPTIFFTLIGLGPLLFFCARPALRSWCLCLAINILLFWAPFCAYNMHAYKAPLVSCAGHDFLAGLGECANPWGIQLNDEWCADYIYKNYGLITGTNEYHKNAVNYF